MLCQGEPGLFVCKSIACPDLHTSTVRICTPARRIFSLLTDSQWRNGCLQLHPVRVCLEATLSENFQDHIWDAQMSVLLSRVNKATRNPNAWSTVEQFFLEQTVFTTSLGSPKNFFKQTKRVWLFLPHLITVTRWIFADTSEMDREQHVMKPNGIGTIYICVNS